MIYDYLNVPANDVAGTIAYARDLNTLINNFVVHSSANNILVVNNAAYVAAVNGVAIPVNVNVVGNAIRDKILDYANGKIFNVATRFQNRSKIRQIISSYINENGGLTESINLINNSQSKQQLADKSVLVKKVVVEYINDPLISSDAKRYMRESYFALLLSSFDPAYCDNCLSAVFRK